MTPAIFSVFRGQQIESIEIFRDVKLELPDYFDYARHSIMFFTYVVDFYPNKDYSAPTDVPSLSVTDAFEVDLDDFIFGDADGNCTVDLKDVTIMLKYLAKWKSVKIAKPIYAFDYDECCFSLENCYYNMPAIISVLKFIAGWDIDSLGLSNYDLARCSPAAYYFV